MTYRPTHHVHTHTHPSHTHTHTHCIHTQHTDTHTMYTHIHTSHIDTHTLQIYTTYRPRHHIHTPSTYGHSPKSSTWAPTHRRCLLCTARGLPPLPQRIQFPHVCTPGSPGLPCLLEGSGVKGHWRQGKLRGQDREGTDPPAPPLPGQAGQQGRPSS